MTDQDPKTTLEAVERAQHSTKALLDAVWFPFVVWGSIVLASAPFTQLDDGDAIGFYWVIAASFGIFITFRFFHVRSADLGLISRHRNAYIGLALFMAFGSMALGIAGQGNMLSAVGPVFVIAAGVAAFAAIDRSLPLAVSALALAAVGVIVLLADPARATLWAALAEGLVLMATGLAAMRADKSAARVRA